MRARYDGHAPGHLREAFFFIITITILKSLLRHRNLEGRRLIADVGVAWRAELAGDIDLEEVGDGSEVIVHPINLCGHDLGES